MIFISSLLVIAFIIFCTSLIKIQKLPARILAGYFFGFSNIVLVLEAASLFHKMNDQWFVLFLQTILLIVFIIIWWLVGKPAILTGVKSIIHEKRNSSIRDFLKQHPLIVTLVVSSLIVYLFNLVLVWIIAPNSSDALHTHLSRVAFWLQNGSLLPWATTNLKQVFYPVDVSLQVFWSFLFWGTDRLTGYVQWIGGIITIIEVFGLARLLHANRAQSAFAAAVWSSFSVVLMQSTSAQVDLTTAALFMGGFYFLILAIKQNEKIAFILSGLGIALALGSKQIILFYLPGLILFCVINLKFWLKHWRRLFTWGISSLVFFMALSSYIYISNYITYKNFAGPDELVTSSVGSDAGTLKYNIPRLIYQSIDFSGLPVEVSSLGNRAKAKFMEALTRITGFSLEVQAGNAQDQSFKYRKVIQTTEDTAWFGFGSLVILLPAVIFGLIRAIKKRDAIVTGLILSSIIFLPFETYFRWGWDPYQGRYFIAAVGLLAPLMAFLVNESKTSKIFRVFASLVVLSAFAMITIFNPSKPLKSSDVNIFEADRAKLQSLAGGGNLWHFTNMINRSLPDDAVVAYYAPSLIYDYTLFGENFSRHVIPLTDPKYLSDEQWLKERGIRFILVNLKDAGSAPLSDKFIPFDEIKGKWMMYTWSKGN